MRHDHFDASASAAGVTTWVGAGTAVFFGGLSISEVMAIGGFLLALIGALTNWWYRHRADRRAQLLHEHRMNRLSAGRGDIDPASEIDE